MPTQLHHGIICDECGESPISGIRYVATHLFEFDICGSCFADHEVSDRASFVAFDQPSPDARAVCKVQDNRITSDSVREAAKLIRENTISTYARITFHHDSTATDRDLESLKLSLQQSRQLEVIFVVMCACGPPAEEKKFVKHITQGIASSTSIKKVYWNTWSQDQDTARAFSSMIQESKTMENLSIVCDCALTKDPGFANIVLEGMRNNRSLQTLRLHTGTKLTEETKAAMHDAVRRNTRIRRMHVEFENKDYRLELLLACNREKWLRRLIQGPAKKRQQLAVLLEALDIQSTNQVPTAYHLLSFTPELILRDS